MVARLATRYFSDLAGAHFGRPAVVIGGGPSAPLHRNQWPSGAVLIGVNEHAMKMGVDAPYLVALDPIYHEKLRPLLQDLANRGQPLPNTLSPYGWATYQLGGGYKAANSGIAAAWCAHIMGCAPVILTGMDLYQTGTYFWDHGALSPGSTLGAEWLAGSWRSMTFDKSAKGVALRVLGDGALSETFPAFDPREQFTRDRETYRPPTIVEQGGRVVRFVKNCGVKSLSFSAGETAIVSVDDARIIVGMGKAELYDEPGARHAG